MNPDLVKLRERVEIARIAHQNAYLMNSQGQTTAHLVEMDLLLRRADRELLEATAAYNKALDAEMMQRYLREEKE